MKDLRDIPKDLRGRIKVTPVARIEEVWPLACDTTKAKPAEAATPDEAPAEA